MDKKLMETVWGMHGLKVPKERAKPKPVMVFNYKTGQFSTYASAAYFYNKYKLSSRIVLPRLKKGEIVPSGYWFYCYYDIDNPIEAQNRLQLAVNQHHWKQQGR